MPHSESTRVFRSEDPLVHEQQLGQQVSGGDQIPRIPARDGEIDAGLQGDRVFWAE